MGRTLLLFLTSTLRLISGAQNEELIFLKKHLICPFESGGQNQNPSKLDYKHVGTVTTIEPDTPSHLTSSQNE